MMPELTQADEGDEEADAARDGGVELVGDGGDEALADASEGKQKEDDAGEEDGAEGGLPGDVHALDDGVGEVGVEAHAGGEGEGVVGEGSHHDGAEGGAEAGGGGDGGEGHAGLREDGGVHEDDVGHRDEGGEAGEDFDAPGGLVLVELEVGFEAGSHARRGLQDAWILGGEDRIPERWHLSYDRCMETPRKLSHQAARMEQRLYWSQEEHSGTVGRHGGTYATDAPDAGD